MKTGLVAWAAIGLWLLTVIAAVVYFIRGQTVPSADGRQAILLAPAERDLVLGEMRAMLISVQGIVQATQAGDRARVAAAARTSGMAAAVDLDPALMAKLPLEFKQLGMGVHRGFDELAAAAAAGAGTGDILARLGTQLSACVGCHAGYRIDPVTPAP
jgi:hypothetical protein